MLSLQCLKVLEPTASVECATPRCLSRTTPAMMVFPPKASLRPQEQSLRFRKVVRHVNYSRCGDTRLCILNQIDFALKDRILFNGKPACTDIADQVASLA